MSTRPPPSLPVRPADGGRPDDQIKVRRLGAIAVDHVDEDWPWEEVEDWIENEPNTQNEKDEEKVRVGMEKELTAMESFGVHKTVPRAIAKGKTFLSTRWVLQDRGDEVRARFVGREFRLKGKERAARTDLFAPATSPTNSRVIDAMANHRRVPRFTFDCKNSFFNAKETEEVYAEPPQVWRDQKKREFEMKAARADDSVGHLPEDLTLDLITDGVWRLERQLYGRQKAPRAWMDLVAEIMVHRLHFNQNPALPEYYFCPKR